MAIKLSSILFGIALPLLSSFTALAQHDQQASVLTVDGHHGKAKVIQNNGRPYVDLQSLVEITRGSLSYTEGRIVLHLPAALNMSSLSPAEPTVPIPTNENGLTQDFMRAGIEEIATMREWASTLAYAIQNNYLVTGDWVANYREQAANDLTLASIAASTEADRRALELLTNEFNALRTWSDKLVEAKQSMDTAKYAMSAGALRNEPLSQKIVTCGHFLASMLGSGTFHDDPSCH